MIPAPVAELTFLLLLRRSLQTFRADARTVAGIAALVFVPLGVARAYVDRALDGTLDGGAGRLALLVVALTVTTASLFGQTFYAGLLDHVVGARHYGHARRSMREVARDVPFGRLIAANAVVALTVVLGYLALVVPGLIALTLLSIVGPLVNVEGHSVRLALRHSVRLVRPRFWLAFVAVTIPLTIEHAVAHALARTVLDNHFLYVLVASAVLATVVGALVGLLEVALAFELVARDREARRLRSRPRRPARSPA